MNDTKTLVADKTDSSKLIISSVLEFIFNITTWESIELKI